MLDDVLINVKKNYRNSLNSVGGGSMRATDVTAACIQALNSPRVNFSKTKFDK